MRELDKPYSYLAYPFVSKGPDGAEEVFESEAEIPAGWTLPEGGVKGGKAKAKLAESEGAQQNATDGAEQSEQPEVDAEGTPFDPAMHTGTLTKAGLWRMKVGVKRPEILDSLDL